MAMISRLLLAGIVWGILALITPQRAFATLEGGPRPQFPAPAPTAAPALQPVAPDVSETSTNSPEGEVTETNTNPYALIFERNCFRLNPPPPPPPPAPTKEEQELKDMQVKITGFIKNKKGPRALFAIPPKDAKETTKYFNLAEGEREGPLEVVKILLDTEQAEVLLNAEKKLTLSLKTNGMVAAAAPANPGPQRPGMVIAPPPPPVAQPSYTPPPAANTGYNSGSGVLVGGAAPASTPQTGAATDSIHTTTPSRTLRVIPSQTYQPQNAAQALQWMDELNRAGASVTPAGSPNTGSYQNPSFPRNDQNNAMPPPLPIY